MFIKKVIVDWGHTYQRHPYLRILFYDPDGNLFESGSTISSTNTTAETDNFIVTALNGAYDASCYPIDAVSTEVYKDIIAPICFTGPSSSATFTIEFKTTIQPI